LNVSLTEAKRTIGWGGKFLKTISIIAKKPYRMCRMNMDLIKFIFIIAAAHIGGGKSCARFYASTLE
jgi:hypothetical protein